MRQGTRGGTRRGGRRHRRRPWPDGLRKVTGSPSRALAPTVVALSLAFVVSACSSSSSGAPGQGRSSAHGPASTAPRTTAPGGATSWTTYGGSFARTSADTGDAPTTASPVRRWTSGTLDGAVDGEPLISDGAVFVATENDTVYGLSAKSGAALWPPDHLATPAPASALPCGDISPTVGVTSTMVVDPLSGTLFASAETAAGGGVGHMLFAISTATGKVLWSRDLDQSWDAASQLQRAALGISEGRVLVGFGGNYGDCGNYNGWVLGVPESGSGPTLHYRVPAANRGGVWAPSGIGVDPSGDVFVATGNGSASPGQAFDHGNAVIELSSQLAERQYFAPTDWAQDNTSDADLGSTAPVLLGDGHVVIVGKQSTGFLLDAGSLGGIGGQLASVGVCPSLGGSAYTAPYLYVVCTDQGRIAQVQVGAALHRGWTWSSPTGGAGSPTLAGGVLWSIDRGASVLYGVDPATGATRFTVPLHVGSLGHFAAPSAAEGLLVVAGGGAVEALG